MVADAQVLDTKVNGAGTVTPAPVKTKFASPVFLTNAVRGAEFEPREVVGNAKEVSTFRPLLSRNATVTPVAVPLRFTDFNPAEVVKDKVPFVAPTEAGVKVTL